MSTHMRSGLYGKGRIFLVFFLWSIVVATISAEDGLIFNVDSWNLGTIRTNSVSLFELGIRNADDSSAEIRLVSTCACLSIEGSPLSLSGGERVTVGLQFDARGEPRGAFEKLIIIQSDVSGQEKMFFLVSGAIQSNAWGITGTVAGGIVVLGTVLFLYRRRKRPGQNQGSVHD